MQTATVIVIVLILAAGMAAYLMRGRKPGSGSGGGRDTGANKL